MTRKDVKGDQPSGGETTWTNTGATRYGRGQHKTGSFGDDMLRPSPNHGTQRLPNDDEKMTMCNCPNIQIRLQRQNCISCHDNHMFNWHTTLVTIKSTIKIFVEHYGLF